MVYRHHAPKSLKILHSELKLLGPTCHPKPFRRTNCALEGKPWRRLGSRKTVNGEWKRGNGMLLITCHSSLVLVAHYLSLVTHHLITYYCLPCLPCSEAHRGRERIDCTGVTRHHRIPDNDGLPPISRLSPTKVHRTQVGSRLSHLSHLFT